MHDRSSCCVLRVPLPPMTDSWRPSGQVDASDNRIRNSQHATPAPNPFDALAPLYDSWFESPMGARVAALERALFSRLAAPRPGETALEVGVGTGFFAREVCAAGARVAGVDLSQPMLEQAAQKGMPLALVRADALALPLQREAFDLVYTVTMLEFVPDPERAVAEMWAALRPGGRLVAAVLNAWSPWALRKAPPFDRAHYFSPPELARLLGRDGRVRWASSVFFLPNGRGMGQAGRLEALGRTVLRPFGAFLVARVEKG